MVDTTAGQDLGKELLVQQVERDPRRVSASVVLGEDEHLLRFKASEDVGQEADFLLAATMLAAMRTGARLKLPGEVSPRLLSAVPKIQDWFRLWDDQEFQRVPVDVGVRNAEVIRTPGVACFFSGGLDSFYTLLKHLDEVTHLILVHGFDGPLEEDPVRKALASRIVREVARELGKSVVEVETNLRTFSCLGAFNKYHGAVLASVALLFQRRFRKVLIPASFNYARLVPWGSHPVLDPLWGTELMDFEHDGCEATRPEKTAYVSKHDIAMEWLRVCNNNPGDIYNCGRCEKCLRTMINLRTAGALERCKTLPSNLDLEAVANMGLRSDTSKSLARQNLKTLERLGTEPELTRALAEALDKNSDRTERVERAKRERLQEQLSKSREQLGITRSKLAKSRKKSGKLAQQNQRLAQHNLQLAALLSRRRYKLVDALSEGFLRIPGTGRLLQRKGTR